jgi:hypothetical protein
VTTSEKQKIGRAYYSAVTGLDYDQPTSLESDLDLLADAIVEAGICNPDWVAPKKSGYLGTVIDAILEENGDKADLLDTVSKIEEILDGVNYGTIDEAEASDLEDLMMDLEIELEEFLDAI